MVKHAFPEGSDDNGPPDRSGGGLAATWQRVAMAVLVVIGAVWPVVGARAVFPYLSINHDEPVYLAQADAIAHGRFTLKNPLPDDPKSVQPWFTLRNGKDFLPKYTPVYAGYLALAKRVTGGFVLALSPLLIASLLLMRRLARRVLSPVEALFATGAFLLSPFVLIQSTLYLPYLFQLVLALAAIELACSYHEASRRRTWRLPILGVLVGLAVWARPVEGIILGVVAAGVLVHAHRSMKPRIVSLALAAVGGIGPVIAMLAYNLHYTGKATRLPVSKFNPNDTVGFGLRNMVRTDPLVEFTLRKGIDGQIAGLRGLERFAFGGVAIGVLVFIGALRLWQRRRVGVSGWALVGYGAMTWVAYITVWGTFFSNTGWHIGTGRVGPFYLLQLLPVVCIVTGSALIQASRRRTATVLAVTVALTGWNLSQIIGSNLEITRIDRRLVRAIDRTPSGAMVFLAFSPPVLFLQHPFQTLRNEAISDDRLFVISSSRDALNAISARRKENYQITFDGSTPKVRPLQLRRGRLLRASLRIDIPQRSGALVARVIGRGGATQVLVDPTPEAGVRIVEFEIDRNGALIDGVTAPPPTRDLASRYRPTRLALSVGVGDNSTEVNAELYVIINIEPDGSLAVLEGPGVWSSDRWPARQYRERPGKLGLTVTAFEVS